MSSTYITENELIETYKLGTYFNPAFKHYIKETNVSCDRCKRENLTSCIGYNDCDLCIQCTADIERNILYNSNPIFPAITSDNLNKDEENLKDPNERNQLYKAANTRQESLAEIHDRIKNDQATATMQDNESNSFRDTPFGDNPFNSNQFNRPTMMMTSNLRFPVNPNSNDPFNNSGWNNSNATNISSLPAPSPGSSNFQRCQTRVKPRRQENKSFITRMRVSDNS